MATATKDYSSDPTISAFGAPSEDFAPSPSPMSGKRPDLQFEEYSPYSLDPTISAFDPLKAFGEAMGGPEEKMAQRPQGNPIFGKALEQMFKLRQGAQATGLSTLDLPLSLPAQIGGGLTYGAARMGATPERAQQISEYVSEPLSYLQPGKLANLANKPIGQGTESYELSPVSQVMGLINKYGAQPAIELLVKQGMAPQDAQQLVTNAPLLAVPGFKLGKMGVETARNLPAWAQELKVPEAGRIEPQMDVSQMPQNVGAAQATPQAVLRGNINSAIANASPELQAHIQSKPLEAINVPAVETRALEEKHGVDLTAGQRTGDLNRYVDEWNARGKTDTLSNHFASQPKQLADAFENAKIKHAPDISSTADASELGQHEINGLAAKDKIRLDNISQAYKALENANGGNFPIDVGTLQTNISSALTKGMKTNRVSPEINADLKSFYENPTFEQYENLRTNLANDMRTGEPNKRAAAYLIRQEVEKLPVFNEENAAFDPQAAQLKQLADKARSLYKERQDVIRSNPAYKAAVKEFDSLEDASSQGESLNAAKFHQKYVSTATPEAIRRMKAEIDSNDLAHQAITFAELERAKNQQVNANASNVKSDRFADFLLKESPRLKAALPPTAMQDVSELGLLSSKIGKPQAGVFNHSNSFSAYLKELAAQGLATAAEAKLASATAGASVPFTMAGKQWMLSRGHENFAKQAIHPYSGLTKE
jgi:hypothetical protein